MSKADVKSRLDVSSQDSFLTYVSDIMKDILYLPDAYMYLGYDNVERERERQNLQYSTSLGIIECSIGVFKEHTYSFVYTFRIICAFANDLTF